MKKQSWKKWQALAQLVGQRALAAEERVRTLEIRLQVLGKLAHASQAVVDGRLTKAEGSLGAPIDGVPQETLTVEYFPPIGAKLNSRAAVRPKKQRRAKG